MKTTIKLTLGFISVAMLCITLASCKKDMLISDKNPDEIELKSTCVPVAGDAYVVARFYGLKLSYSAEC